MAKTEAVERATGRTRAQWFAALDKWGAPGRPFREISDWLTAKHGVSKWWAQKLIVEYEQERGLRPPGVRPNGTFEVSASKTIGVPVDQLFDAFANSRRRNRWLTDGKMILQDSAPGRSVRFKWEDGATRVRADFERKGAGKSAVVVAHDRIAKAGEAQKMKAKWRERLGDLKTFLES